MADILTPDEVFKLDTLEEIPIDVRGVTYRVRELDAATMAAISRSCRRDNDERDEAEFRARVIQAGCVSPAFGIEHLERIKKLSNTLHTALFVAIVNGKKN